MSSGRQQPMVSLLLDLLPPDGTRVANGRLFERLHVAAHAAGLRCGEQDFATAREALVAAGQAVKGPGRGGSTARVVGAIAGPATGVAEGAPPARADGPAVEEQRPEFSLQAQSAPAERPFAAPSPTRMAAPKPGAPRRSDPAPGAPQVLSYRHPDRRINNPEVGLVNEASDPAQPKTTWAYDPHLDPVLQWTGKAERGSFEVDTVSLHVHERVDPMSILAAVAGSRGDKAGKVRPHGIQPGLFEAPFESLPLRDAVDFYRHDKGWSNRLVAGDSLLVMNSLLVKEGLAGQVQMIYIDPPYGIRYGSNFQPFVNKRDVKDRADADLTQEPEMIKAFRDTWELGIHSYLTYLRDRLLLARELLSETGSVFVQISDENLHHVRELMDEVFGMSNFVSLISVSKTSAVNSPLARTMTLAGVTDYLVWYAKDLAQVKYRQLYREKVSGKSFDDTFKYVELPTGERASLNESRSAPFREGKVQGRLFALGDSTSQKPTTVFEFEYQGRNYSPGSRGWRTVEVGMTRVAQVQRWVAVNQNLRYVSYSTDFPVIALNDLWEDTGTGSFLEAKTYVVGPAKPREPSSFLANWGKRGPPFPSESVIRGVFF